MWLILPDRGSLGGQVEQIAQRQQERYLSEPSGGCHRWRSEPVKRRYEIDLEHKGKAGRTRRPGRAKEDDRSCDVDSIAGVHVTESKGTKD